MPVQIWMHQDTATDLFTAELFLADAHGPYLAFRTVEDNYDEGQALDEVNAFLERGPVFDDLPCVHPAEAPLPGPVDLEPAPAVAC